MSDVGNGHYDPRFTLLDRDVRALEARFDKLDDSLLELRKLFTEATTRSEIALNTVHVIAEQHTRQLEAIATIMLEVRRELKPKRPRVKAGATARRKTNGR